MGSFVNLADPHFGQPGNTDVLLGVDIIVLETEYGWVLAGEVDSSVTARHTAKSSFQTSSLHSKCPVSPYSQHF